MDVSSRGGENEWCPIGENGEYRPYRSLRGGNRREDQVPGGLRGRSSRVEVNLKRG